MREGEGAVRVTALGWYAIVVTGGIWLSSVGNMLKLKLEC